MSEEGSDKQREAFIDYIILKLKNLERSDVFAIVLLVIDSF